MDTCYWKGKQKHASDQTDVKFMLTDVRGHRQLKGISQHFWRVTRSSRRRFEAQIV